MDDSTLFRSPRPTVLAASCVALMVASLGCRQAPASPAAAVPALDLDACILLTYSEAEAIAGFPLRRMKTYLDQESGAQFAKCSYGDPSLLGKTVSLELRRHESPDAARRVQEAARSQVGRLAAGEVRDIQGLGEAAFWADYRVDQLHVLQGDLRMIITVTMGDDAERLSSAEAVVRRVFERLATGEAAASPPS